MKERQTAFRTLMTGIAITAFGLMLLVDGILWFWLFMAGPGLMILAACRTFHEKK